jgi:hypothetical protein
MSAPIWFTKGAGSAGDKSRETSSPGKAATLPAVMPKAAPGKGIPAADRLPDRPAATPAPAQARPPEPAPEPQAAPAQAETTPAAPAAPRAHGLNGASSVAERPRAPRGSMPFPAGPGAPAAAAAPSPGSEMGCPAHSAQEERSAQLEADEAGRLLALAERSLAVVETALKRAGAPDATVAEDAAGRAVQGCMDALAAAVGPVNRAVDNLRAAAKGGAPARLTAAQAAAMETFAKCAIDATEASRAAGGA